MKGLSSVPGDYVYFKSQVPLHKISIGSKQWRYYDYGPKSVPPLICLPGIAGTADVYYKQIMSLSTKNNIPASLPCSFMMWEPLFFLHYTWASRKWSFHMINYIQGYRVVSLDLPRVWNHLEWVHAFEKFLDTINVHYVHIYGTSLGGFLAQVFAQLRPRRVKSLVLSNTFIDTEKFSASMPWSPVVGWTPSFLLKRYILTGIRDGPQEPFISDSVDFVVGQVETLSRDDLSSLLTLNATAASVGPLLLSDSLVTIMDASNKRKTNDYCAIPQSLKDQVSERYPGARRAIMKSGGDFPFLSRPDEVNLHLQLHLRRAGVEAKQGQGRVHDDKGGENENEDEDNRREGHGSSGSHLGSSEPHSSYSAEGDDGSPSDDQGGVDHEPQQAFESAETCCLDGQPLEYAIGAIPLVLISSILMIHLEELFGALHTAKKLKV